MTIDKHVRFDDDVVKLVDDWRRGQSPIPSFNTAINTILRDLLVNKFVDHAEPVLAYDGKPYAYRIYGVPHEVKEQ